MASPTTIYLTPVQRQRMFKRARRRKTSFSEELRSAVDFYLQLPPDMDVEGLEAMARETNAAMDRSVVKLDATIAQVKKTIAKLDAIDRRLDELAQDRL